MPQVALFVSLNHESKLKSPHVYLFPVRSKAVEIAVDAIVDAGWIVRNADGTFTDEHGDETWPDAEAALEAIQQDLMPSEYLNIYSTTNMAERNG